MKKYILKILAFALCVITPFVLFYCYLLNMHDSFGASIPGTLRYKIPLIETTNSPKIVMTGGSSSPYGVNCEYIAQEMNENCICIGATAYLGKEIYFNILRPNVQSGDTIVLGFESGLLQDKGIDYSLVWQAAGKDINVWKYVPLSYYPGVIGSTMRYYNDKKSAAVSDGQYNKNFGPLGDVITERESILESKYNRLDLHYLTADSVSKDEIEKINKFAEQMMEKGVSVYFAFAPLDTLCVTSTQQEIDEYTREIKELLNIPIILSFEDALMDGEYFYDSNNHLTTRGAEIYSQKLVEGLKLIDRIKNV